MADELPYQVSMAVLLDQFLKVSNKLEVEYLDDSSRSFHKCIHQCSSECVQPASFEPSISHLQQHHSDAFSFDAE